MHLIEIIQTISSQLATICAGLIFFFGPLACIVVRSHYDTLFSKVGGGKGEVGNSLRSLLLRTSNYSLCVTWKNQSINKPYFFKLYKGYDFRGNATKVIIVLSFGYVYSTFAMVFFGIIGIIANLLLGNPLTQ